MEDKRKIWLIKSGNNIIGPMDFDHVLKCLLKGKIKLSDEIKRPFERWNSINNNSLFTVAFEKLKSSQKDRRENTLTATLNIENTKTQDLTATSELTTTDDLTVIPTENKAIHKKNIDKSPGKTKTQKEPTSRKHPLSVNQPPKNIRPPTPKTSSVSRGRLLTFIIGFIVLSFFSFWLLEFEKIKKNEETQLEYARLTDIALKAMKVGDYPVALKNFNKAYKLSPEDPNLFIQVAPLVVQFEGQFAQVQENLDRFMSNSKDKSFLNKSKNVIGLIQSYRNRHKEALIFYNEILSVDEKFLPAIVNKAFSLLKLNQPLSAMKFMESKARIFHGEPIVQYLYIRSLIEAGLKEDPKYLKKAFVLAEKFSKRFFEFKQEVLFLVSFGKMRLDSKSQLWFNSVKDFLKVDIELTNLHLQNPYFDFQSSNWLDYIPYCKEMQENIDYYFAELLKGFCFLKAGLNLKGKQTFENLIGNHSHKGMLQGFVCRLPF